MITNLKPSTPRARVRERYSAALSRGEFLVGAAIGAGILGYSAEQGGADFVVALNAGRFRLMGAASVTCMLPIRDSNRFVESFAPSELLSQCSVPVYFGASALDSGQSVDELVDHIADMGFSGIINFPTVVHYPEPVRKALDATNIGFSREISLLTTAQDRGLSALAHVRTREQARLAAANGIDMICFNFGWNAGGEKGLNAEMSVEEAAAHAREIAHIVARENSQSLFVLEGGPIEDPKHLTTVCRIARIHGYIGGSTLDRMPLAESVIDQTIRFKSVASLARNVGRREAELVTFGRKIGLAGSSEAMIRVYQKVERFLGSNESMIISGELGTGRQTTVEALHSLAGAQPGTLAVVDAREYSGQQLMISIFGRGAAHGGSRELTGLAARDDVQAITIRGFESIPSSMHQRISVYMERGRFRPIGGRRSVVSGKRLLFVAEHSLASLRAEGKIDADMARQLEGHDIHIPSLRDRSEDIQELLDKAIEQLTGRNDKTGEPVLSPSAMQHLRRHDWPGNLPELRTLAAKLVSRHAGARVGKKAVETLLDRSADPARRKIATERDLILDALWRHGFHRGKTAAFLGVSRKTLYNKIQRYGLMGPS